MRTRRKTTALVLLAVGIVLFGPAPQAQATLVLEGTFTPSGESPITIWATDNNVAYPGGAPAGSVQLTDLDPAVGNLALVPGTIVPGFSIGALVADDEKSLGLNRLIMFNPQDIVNTSGGAVAMSIQVGDNNFVGPATTATAAATLVATNAAGPPNPTLNLSFYDDPTNTQPLAGPGFSIPGNQIASASHTFT